MSLVDVLLCIKITSSEIRFAIDPETGVSVNVLEKQHLETMSMIEEFILLANISVTEKIHEYLLLNSSLC
ncbi:unnamed protein product [Meloidogyne enterolobii]|uniref:Uncharacterized protein n=1 Tax=Meloidogyne enterolobii TaxID=390850 RepID=A0ACB1AP24_MELEN